LEDVCELLFGDDSIKILIESDKIFKAFSLLFWKDEVGNVKNNESLHGILGSIL
jgi:hypothetical protein